LHQDIGNYARDQQIDKVFCLGQYTAETAKTFGEKAQHFAELEPLLKNLKQEMKNNMTVLVKGSRGMRMERVIEALEVSESTKGASI